MIGDRAKPTVIRLRFTPADGAWAVTWDSNKDAKDACFPLVKGEVDVKPGHDQGYVLRCPPVALFSRSVRPPIACLPHASASID